MYTSAIYVEAKIEKRYHKLQRRAKLAQALHQITGRASALRSMAQALHGHYICGQHYEGYKNVQLDQIVGSEGRSEDFDGQYRPLKGHTAKRWYSVAQATLTGVTLPPVSLIRIGDAYYVRDGNHRVSVARAFGQAAIEAEVTVYHLAPQAIADRAPVARQEAPAAA